MTQLIQQLHLRQPYRWFNSYPSPEWATAELLPRLPLELGDVILDPASGNNAIAKVIQDFSNQIYVFTNDIDPHQCSDFHFDMTLEASWQWLEYATGGFDWVISYPPCYQYLVPGKKSRKSIIHLFVKMAYKYAAKGVIFLMRKSLTEPIGDRRSWLQEYRQEQFLELRLERIRFFNEYKNKYDDLTCDWYGWQHGHQGGFVPEYIWCRD